MSELGGDGPLCIAVMWSLTFIVFVFLLIRVYTRVVCVAAYGIDDHFYLLSMVNKPKSNVLSRDARD
jgi:hypothetical protein